MRDLSKKQIWMYVPDPSRVEKKGMSVDAPTPTQFTILDPWNPSAGNGGAPERSPGEPSGSRSGEPTDD